MLPTHQHAAKQDGGVNRGHFGIERARSRGHVHEVVEEAVHSKWLHRVQQEIERCKDASRNVRARLIAALIANAQRCQPEACRRDAGNRPRIVARGQRAIFHLTRIRVGLFPEE
ncbi:MAG: hypothetical protein DMG33_07430 [Acidobacteria bacterium]|nr:MAG: hypothetical protein DMG33_07430 [Acidobacteriota bacterium]